MSTTTSHQEWVLSARRLYFTNVQVYFECAESLRNEDAWVVKPGSNNSPPVESDVDGNFRLLDPTLLPPLRLSPAWPRFRELLADYTGRYLSYNNDIFNACAGLHHHVYGLSRRGNRLIFGLPESNFHDALIWTPKSYTVRIPESVEVVIPS